MKRIAKAALLILGALSVVASIAAWMVYQNENISRDEARAWERDYGRMFHQNTLGSQMVPGEER